MEVTTHYCLSHIYLACHAVSQDLQCLSPLSPLSQISVQVKIIIRCHVINNVTYLRQKWILPPPTNHRYCPYWLVTAYNPAPFHTHSQVITLVVVTTWNCLSHLHRSCHTVSLDSQCLSPLSPLSQISGRQDVKIYVIDNDVICKTSLISKEIEQLVTYMPYLSHRVTRFVVLVTVVTVVTDFGKTRVKNIPHR